MKFWLLTTEYPPQSGGGISTYCWHTARMLAQQGVDVTVFIPGHRTPSVVIQEERIRLVYVSAENSTQNKFLGWEAAISYEFSKVLKEFEEREGAPDFVESQEYAGIAYYPLQRRMLETDYLANSVFFVTAHAPSFLYLDYNQAPCFQFPEYWVGEMERSVLKSADFVLSTSQYLLDQLSARMGSWNTATRVVKNPFLSFKPALEFVKGDLVFFGKLTKQKGALEMLELFRDMWDAGFTASIRIVGGGDHFFYPRMMDMGDYVRKRFSKYIEKGLLIFEGHIPPDQIETRLSQAHVVVVPSTVDNLPYTVLEAMSLGKVVLVSEQGGHAELIRHQTNGFIFSHNDPGSFHRALDRIMKLGAEEVKAIGAAAHQTIASGCSYESVCREKMQLLKDLAPDRTRSHFPFIRPRPRANVPPTGQANHLLSIIVPYYNLGNFIEDCIRSIVNSDYSEKEVIIINDGSTDTRSVEILGEIEAKYSVSVVHQRNLGLCDTRNKGANMAKGEFLAFLDADDTVEPSYYTKAIQVLKKFENVSFVGCWAKYFGENDEIWPAFNPEPPYLLAHNSINSSAVVYKTRHFVQAGGNDPSMTYGMEDYETVINMVKQGFQGVVMPDVLWNYRIRTGSMAQSFNRFSELYLYRLISRKHAGFFAEYAEDLVNILNANGPSMYYKNPTLAVPEYRTPFRSNSWVVKFIRRNKILRKLAKKLYARFFGHL